MVNLPFIALILFVYACAVATVAPPWAANPFSGRFFWPLWPSIVVIVVNIGALPVVLSGQKGRGSELMWWGIAASFVLAPIAWLLNVQARRITDNASARRRFAVGYVLWLVAAIPHLWYYTNALQFAFTGYV